MLTNEEKKLLKVVAAYNDITEDQAKAAIVKLFLQDLVAGQDTTPLIHMALPVIPKAVAGPEINLAETKMSEKPKRKGGRPRKTVSQFVEEVHEADRMTKDEFVDYFSQKGAID